jgi:Papain family cysteine protease
MQYPTSVDLRSNINTVYNQAANNACMPHALVNALDAMYDHAGKSKRFSRSHLWYWGRHWMGTSGVNAGVSIEAAIKTVSTNGIMTEADCPWEKTYGFIPQGEVGFTLVRTQIDTDMVGSIKRLLCMGVPVVWIMRVTPMFSAMAFYHNWKNSEPIPPDVSQVMGEHVVCIVGYDDTCQRFLIENSYGKDWGDGGFFGLPYTSLPALTEGFLHFDFAPITPRPVEGYIVTTPKPSLIERSEFFDASKTALRQILIEAFTRNPQDFIDTCKTWGVSDKHVEYLAEWPRGTVRNYKSLNLHLNWDGFIWNQL